MKRELLGEINRIIANGDIILYVLDARFIAETRNPEIEEKIKEVKKKVIYVINKADIAKSMDQDELDKISPYIAVSCRTGGGISRLRIKIRIIAKQLKKETVFIGVIGYPNTGKSSVINMLTRKKEVARTSPEAGFTKGVQRLRLSEGIYLLDTPGIIPENERFGNQVKLAKIGARTQDNLRNPEMIIYELMKKYPAVFEAFYGIDANGDAEKLIEGIGRKRNLLIRGNNVDTDRTARFILNDWQRGRIKV